MARAVSGLPGSLARRKFPAVIPTRRGMLLNRAASHSPHKLEASKDGAEALCCSDNYSIFRQHLRLWESEFLSRVKINRPQVKSN